jgi:hypothetical protein
VAQAALGDEFAASTGAASLRDALRGLGLSPDVRSTGDLVTALTSGNLRMFEALTSAVLAIALLFGLPLGGGYRLAQMCLGQPGHAGSRRRTSPLCRRAAQMHTAQREARAARSLGAELRREVPLDLFVKAALCAAAAFWLLDVARTTAPPQEYEGGALPAKSMLLVLVLSVLAVVPLAGRLTWRGHLISARTSLTANVVLVLVTCGLALRLALARGLGLSDVGTWVAIALALLLGLAWLSSRAIGRHQGSRWIVVPLAATLAAGMLASTDDALVPPDFRSHAITRTGAIEDAGLDAVPRLSRGDLQMLLLSRTRLADADLRTQDMHLLSLRERDLAGAQLVLADLTHADLRRADLRAADLSAARAAGATLRGANLAGANLRCADLRGADLRGATLTGALLDATIVNDATRLPRGLGSRQRSKLRHRSGSTRIPDGRSFYASLWTCQGLPSARPAARAAVVAPAVPTRFLSSRPAPRPSDRIHP